jgi:hypothetical protein
MLENIFKKVYKYRIVFYTAQQLLEKVIVLAQFKWMRYVHFLFIQTCSSECFNISS